MHFLESKMACPSGAASGDMMGGEIKGAVDGRKQHRGTRDCLGSNTLPASDASRMCGWHIANTAFTALASAN